MVSSDAVRAASAPGLGARVLAPVGFLVAYLAVSPLSGAVADRPLPLPDAPESDAVAYFAANPVPVGITAVLQVVSVACLAVFVAAMAPALRAAGAGWTVWAGYLSGAAMVVSSLLSVLLAATVTQVDESTVGTLRMAGFYAGGVVCVVALGAFVLGAALALGRARLFGRAVTWFGGVAGAVALLSVVSPVVYYANAALPVGRVLGMVWTIVAGIAVHRRVRAESR